MAEDGPYHATHRLIRVEEHLAVPLPPYEPDRKAPAELTSCRLVADPALEPGTEHVQLGFAHRALQAQHEPVVEARRVIEPVRVADERVGQPAEIEEPIPVGVVARETADLETEHDADVAERDLGGEVGKATPGDGPRSGKPEVLVDHDDRGGRPTELDRPALQRVLAIGGLGVVLELALCRLTDIDERLAPEMGLAGPFTHRRTALWKKGNASRHLRAGALCPLPPRHGGADRRPGDSPANKSEASSPSGPEGARRRDRCARSGHKAGRQSRPVTPRSQVKKRHAMCPRPASDSLEFCVTLAVPQQEHGSFPHSVVARS